MSRLRSPGRTRRHDPIRVSRFRCSGHCAGDLPMVDPLLAGTSPFNHALSDPCISALVRPAACKTGTNTELVRTRLQGSLVFAPVGAGSAPARGGSGRDRVRLLAVARSGRDGQRLIARWLPGALRSRRAAARSAPTRGVRSPCGAPRRARRRSAGSGPPHTARAAACPGRRPPRRAPGSPGR
jgi:hypothetical protein